MDWRGKRVFVTGHTGFKGSWLSLLLQKSGASVRGYALEAPASPNLFEAAAVGKGMDSVIGDIRDQAHLQRELQAFQPELLMHLAAQSLVRLSYAQPVQTYAVNVMGTAHVLEAARSIDSLRAVLVITTDKCYENKEWVWAYRENDRLGGYDPYSNSKAAAELVTSSYRSSFFNPAHYPQHGVALATARAGNVIGGGDWAEDRLLPDLMRSFRAGEPVIIRNPQAVRPWQHVLEPLRGYLALAAALLEDGPDYGEAWNFGPREMDALPVSRIVERVAALWTAHTGLPARWERGHAPQVHEANHLRLDCAKAASRLAWQPVLSIDEALELTVAWYAACRNTREMRAFTLAQVDEYQGRVRQAAAPQQAPEPNLLRETV